jgi:hypothetical protein
LPARFCRLNALDQRFKTLDEHIKRSGNFKKHLGYKARYEKLYAEHKALSKQTGLFSKGKAQKAHGNVCCETCRAEIGQFEAGEKYLRDELLGRFDQNRFPAVKWKAEQETLKLEHAEYAFWKAKSVRWCLSASTLRKRIGRLTQRRESGIKDCMLFCAFNSNFRCLARRTIRLFCEHGSSSQNALSIGKVSAKKYM